VRRFNHEDVLIPDLQDRITYIAFLNDILSSKFKFSLAESKVTNLADTLRKAQDFIGAIKICAGDASNQHENRKRLGGDWDAQLDKHPKWNEERCGHFHTSPCNSDGNQGKCYATATQTHRKLRPSLEIRTNIVSTMRTLDIQRQNIGSERKRSMKWLIEDNLIVS